MASGRAWIGDGRGFLKQVPVVVAIVLARRLAWFDPFAKILLARQRIWLASELGPRQTFPADVVDLAA